jgi:hypothetical protein
MFIFSTTQSIDEACGPPREKIKWKKSIVNQTLNSVEI